VSAHALDSAVSALMARVGREIVMPHFRVLRAEDIQEKTPGDLVTIADREAEDALSEGLLAIFPEARVIGEEACAADPRLLDNIASGTAWIVDPIDGTGNYAAGEPPFAIMVALVADGEMQAAWILDPTTGRMCHAASGKGAFVDGARVRSRATGLEKPVAAIAARYLPGDLRETILGRAAGHFTQVPTPRAAGEQYPRVVLGENDLTLFWRALPWDHAPGALFLTEAGGRIARFDGAPYRIGEDRTGLLAAATPALWDRAAAILFS
jgi:fructose-1,6-bisphosphatase/inositol monophosphatase family enzyme